MKRFIAIALLALPLAAQSTSAQDNALVTVPRKYVSTEGLTHAKDEPVSKWIGFGREIGEATKEGLSAVVDQAERFGTTRVGNFVMLMVAWRILGHDLLRVVLGVPLYLFGVGIWIWSYRRFFMTRRVLVKEDKANKTKEYAESKPYQFYSGDAKAGCAWGHVLVLLLWSAFWLIGIFF